MKSQMVKFSATVILCWLMQYGFSQNMPASFSPELLGTEDFSFVQSTRSMIGNQSEVNCQVFILDFLLSDTTVLLRAIPASGVPPYSFLWSTGASNTQIEIDLASTDLYCVTMTDGDGCESIDCYQGNQNPACEVEIFQFNSNNGYLLIASARGSNPILFNWSNGDNAMTTTVTEAGEYCVSISDANECIAENCISIAEDWVGECNYSVVVSINEDSTAAIIDIDNFNNIEFTSYSLNGRNVSFPVEVQHQGNYTITAQRTNPFCQVEKEVFVNLGRNCTGTPSIEASNNIGFNVLTANLVGGSNELSYFWLNDFSEDASIVANMSTTYCVQIFDNGVGCLYQTCRANIILGTQLYGSIQDPQGGSGLRGVIYIYQLQDTGPVLTDSILASGFFNTFISREFDHIVKIQPESIGERSFAPSFYIQSLLWEEADTIKSTQIQLNGIGPIAIEIHETEGIGLISGHLTAAAENLSITLSAENETYRGTGYGNYDIVLFNLDENAVVGHVKTEPNGFFQFDNLALGNYRVLISIPGISSLHQDILLTEDRPHNGNADFLLQQTEASEADALWTILPNPIQNELYIENNSKTLTADKIIVYDSQGKIILSSNNPILPQSKTMLLTNDWLPGLYIVQINSDSGIHTAKVIKQ